MSFFDMIDKPRVRFPQGDVTGKFVQLFIGDEPYLRADYMSEYHRVILTNTLKEFEIEFGTTIGRRGIEIPEAEGERYRVVGMGTFTMKKNRVSLFSDSADYGIRPDRDHLDKLNPLLDGLTIKIE